MDTGLRKQQSDLPPGIAPQRRVSPRKTPKARQEESEIALRLRPDGIEEVIPLTREILLNPSLDIQVPQGPPHDDKLHSLDERLRPFLRAQGLRVHSDVIVKWPKVRKVSPDLSVFESLREKKPGKDKRDSIDVAAEGCRVRAVFEVISPGKLARWKDETKNPSFFAQHGVDDLVLVYLPEHREPDAPPLRVYSDPTPAGYTEQAPDPEGFFLLRSIGVRIGVEGTDDDERIVLLDAATGKRLPDVEEATQQAEQAGKQAAQAEKQAEQAKKRAEQAEQLNKELMAEIERLRALHDPADSDAP